MGCRSRDYHKNSLGPARLDYAFKLSDKYSGKIIRSAKFILTLLKHFL